MKTKPKPKKPKHYNGREDQCTVVGDFLADLGHYCDRHELSLGELLQKAKMHYEAETKNEGTQFNFL